MCRDERLPVVATFTQRAQVSEETAKRITRDALVVGTPIRMLGDADFDIFEWHDGLIDKVVVPVTLYNPRNTNDPLDIRYKIQDCLQATLTTFT